MTAVWLLVWVLVGTPDVSMWDSWAIALIVCIIIDIISK